MAVKKSKETEQKLKKVKLTNRMKRPYIVPPQFTIGPMPDFSNVDFRDQMEVNRYRNALTQYGSIATKSLRRLEPNASMEVDKNAIELFARNSVAFKALLDTGALITDRRVKDVHESLLIKPDAPEIPIELTNEAQGKVTVTEEIGK